MQFWKVFPPNLQIGQTHILLSILLNGPHCRYYIKTWHVDRDVHFGWHPSTKSRHLVKVENEFTRTYCLRTRQGGFIFYKIEFDQIRDEIKAERIWNVEFDSNCIHDGLERPRLYTDSVVAFYDRTSVTTGSIHVCDIQKQFKETFTVRVKFLFSRNFENFQIFKKFWKCPGKFENFQAILEYFQEILKIFKEFWNIFKKIWTFSGNFQKMLEYFQEIVENFQEILKYFQEIFWFSRNFEIFSRNFEIFSRNFEETWTFS